MFPYIPYSTPQLHATFTICWNALVIYRPLNTLVIFVTLDALVISMTFGHTGNLYHIKCTHSFDGIYISTY